MVRRGGLDGLRPAAGPRPAAAEAGDARGRRPVTASAAPARQAIIRRRWRPARACSRTCFPLGSRVNERGRLEIGGCDTIELAREFGTPAYVVAEDDLRARARAFMQAGRDAGHEDFQVVFASKAFPCTAVLALFARGGPVVRRRLRRRAAPGAGGRASRPSGSCCTATPSREAELRMPRCSHGSA